MVENARLVERCYLWDRFH